MGKKNYIAWHTQKQKVNASDKKVFYKEREIWWVHVGANVGTEIDGKHKTFERPLLVLKYINKNQFVGVPMTSKSKNSWYFTPITGIDGQKGFALHAQIKVLSTKRLIRKVNIASTGDFHKIKSKIIMYLIGNK